jgi:hypothetical protein
VCAATPLAKPSDSDVTAAEPGLSGINLSRPSDSGINLHGYASDFGATWIIGNEPSAIAHARPSSVASVTRVQ